MQVWIGQSKACPTKMTGNVGMKDKTNITEFGKRLVQLCKEADLPKKQVDLAREFGVTPSMVWHYLHGEKLPSMDTAIDMARKLDCHVEYLLTGRGPKRIAGQDKYLEMLYNNITPEKKRIFDIVNVADAAIKESERKLTLESRIDILMKSIDFAGNKDHSDSLIKLFVLEQIAKM